MASDTGDSSLDAEMANQERRARYVALWVLALVFGWIEASVIVYLREVSIREVALHTPSDLTNLQITLASLPSRLVALEMAREACTLVLLAAVGWLAGRRPADRIGAFFTAFGIWDLTYYAVLRLVSGWPDSISTWDILFLIPSPWVAPVWAPVTVATLLVAGGSYLFWTADHARRYRWTDLGVLLISVCLTVAAFLVESRTVVDHQVPKQFPIWLFWSGVALGSAWFVRVERRAVLTSGRERPWIGVRVRTIVPTHTTARIDQSGGTTVENTMLEGSEGNDIECVSAAYRDARRRQDVLIKEAGELAERFEQLAQVLSAHPGDVLIGLPDERLENPSKWDIVPSHPLPSIEQLVTLTNGIRAVGARVEELRARLILLGHAELVEQANGFFH
jgi:hypothetical protein